MVLKKTLESPLEISPVSWIFFGRTDIEAKTLILWPPDVKNWLIGKDLDAGKYLSSQLIGPCQGSWPKWILWGQGFIICWLLSEWCSITVHVWCYHGRYSGVIRLPCYSPSLTARGVPFSFPSQPHIVGLCWCQVPFWSVMCGVSHCCNDSLPGCHRPRWCLLCSGFVTLQQEAGMRCVWNCLSHLRDSQLVWGIRNLFISVPETLFATLLWSVSSQNPRGGSKHATHVSPEM